MKDRDCVYDILRIGECQCEKEKEKIMMMRLVNRRQSIVDFIAMCDLFAILAKLDQHDCLK